MNTVLIEYEGVLSHGWNTPIPSGTLLYHALCDAFNVYVGTINEVDLVERELRDRGMKKHVGVLTAPGEEEPVGVYLSQLFKLRCPMAFIVSANPHVAVQSMVSWAIPTLVVTHPRYVRPEFRPDGQGVATWESITQRAGTDAEAMRQDKRLRDVYENLYEELPIVEDFEDDES